MGRANVGINDWNDDEALVCDADSGTAFIVTYDIDPPDPELGGPEHIIFGEAFVSLGGERVRVSLPGGVAAELEIEEAIREARALL